MSLPFSPDLAPNDDINPDPDRVLETKSGPASRQSATSLLHDDDDPRKSVMDTFRNHPQVGRLREQGEKHVSSFPGSTKIMRAVQLRSITNNTDARRPTQLRNQ
jgi:hypothetical protein